MEGYLGETELTTLAGTPFEHFGPTEWALEYIGRYGQIDGAHHKTWVLDQVARILKGTKVDVVVARWENGDEEYRYSTDEPPSDEYLEWVDEMKRGKETLLVGVAGSSNSLEIKYCYDEGIAP